MGSKKNTLKQLVSRLQDESNFPAISEYITELGTKAAPTSKSSANELAALILRDYSLTSKLLKVSNSAMYGQFSGTIATVSRAVVILGFEQVQLTAAGLIFFEHLQDKSNANNIKEAVLSAFLSGILARDLARMLKIEGWEDFYIGAMFHNFGRLLVMSYFNSEFEVYQKLLDEGATADEETERKILGVSFAELGMEIARTWCLPEQIIVSMKVPSAEELKKSGSEVNHRQLLPHLANELCDLAINVEPKDRMARVEEMLKKYSKAYPVRLNEIMTMLDDACVEMRRFTDVLRLNKADLKRLDPHNSAGDADSSRDQEGQAAATLSRLEVAVHTPPSGLLTREQRKQHLQDGLQEITNIMLDDFDLDDLLSMILETTFRGIGFNRLVIFLKDPQRERMLARYALGPNTTHLIGRFGFPLEPAQEDLFNMALAENKDLYIANIADDGVQSYRPEWFSGNIFSPSLALYPIVLNKTPAGIIYGGFDTAGRKLDLEQLNTLKTLRNQAALALKQTSAA